MKKALPTSFSIDWYDCGLCCGDSIVREQIAISRDNKRITIKQFNGANMLLVKTEVVVAEDLVDSFFLQIEELHRAHRWEHDYSVMVCDGFSWEMVIRWGAHTAA